MEKEIKNKIDLANEVLKVCPFCGGIAKVKRYCSVAQYSSGDSYYIKCNNCKCKSKIFQLYDEDIGYMLTCLIDLWNMRVLK